MMFYKKINLKKILIFIVCFFVIFLSRWKLFLNSGVIGHNWDWSIPLLKSSNLELFNQGKYIWNTFFLGVSDIFFRFWNFYLHFLGIFLGGEFLSKFIIFFILSCGFLSFYFFIKFFIKKVINFDYNKEKEDYLLFIIPSLLYVLNPFIFNDIISGSLIYLIAYSLLPLTLLFFIKYIYTNKFKNVIYFSFVIFFVSGSTQMYIFSIILCFSFLIYYFFNKKSILNGFKIFSFSLLIISILLIPLLYNSINLQKTTYSKRASANTAVQKYSNQFLNTQQNILRSFTLESFLDRNIFSHFLIIPYYFIFYCSIFLLIIISIFFVINNKKLSKKNIIFVLLSFIISITVVSISKNPITGNMFLWLMDNFIPARAFSTTYHLVFFSTFSTCLLISFALLNQNKKYYAVFIVLIMLINIQVFVFGDNGINILKNQKRDSIDQYYPNNEFIKYSLATNLKKLDYRMLSIPMSYSPYYLKTKNQNYGQGGDPDLLTLKPSTFENFVNTSYVLEKDLLYNKNVNNNLYSLFNFRDFIIKTDVVSNFSNYKNDYDYSKLIKKFENNMLFKSKYFNNGEFNIFLQHFYTPQTIIKSSQNISVLPDIVSQNDYNIRSATYFSDNTYNADDKSVFNPNAITKTEVKNTPTIEFKKVNPTKYKVIIHDATSEFPLIFSESFHDGWKAYLTSSNNLKTEKTKIQNEEILKNYKILDGNSDDQASIDELKSYIDKGYISSLGDLKQKNIKHVKWDNNKEVFDYNEPYKIDFISKDFNGTIQNDNLDSGHFYETWSKTPISDSNHSMVNGYANSWNIDPNSICNNNSKCTKNADGSYDMEFTIEFWPQRLFYLGLIISGTTLIGCIVYLIVDGVKNKKKKEEEKENNNHDLISYFD